MVEQEPSAEDQKSTTDEPPSTAVVAGSPNPETTQRSNHPAESKQRDYYDYITLGIAILALIGVWYYAYWAKIQAQGTINAAKAAQASAEAAKSQAQSALVATQTAQQQLTLSERPWIKISFKIAKPMTFDTPPWNRIGNESVAEIVIENTVENVGAFLALDVIVWEDIVPMERTDILGCCGPVTFQSAITHQTQKCDTYRHPFPPPMLLGPMLFPHDKPDISNYFVDLPMEQVRKAIASSPKEGKVAFVFVGCVSYRFPFEALDIPRHETKFLYLLGKPDANGTVDPNMEPSGVHPEIQLENFAERFSAD